MCRRFLSVIKALTGAACLLGYGAPPVGAPGRERRSGERIISKGTSCGDRQDGKQGKKKGVRLPSAPVGGGVDGVLFCRSLIVKLIHYKTGYKLRVKIC